MVSNASLLINREFTSFQRDPPWGIELFPLNDDNFELAAKIQGLKNTIWEGGIFQVYIKFDEDYNKKPPAICFHTIPFHPNIDAITGEPCLDLLHPDNWNKDFSLVYILISVQALLSNPNLREAVNLEALDMIEKSPKRYRQTVAQCIKASNDLEDKIKSEISLENAKNYINENKPVKTAPRKISKLSFEDYYTTWCGIATSKSKPLDSNPLLQQLRDKPELHRTHMALRQEEIEDQIKKQIDEHTMLMYGKFDSKPTVHDDKEAKLARLQKMKRIYLPPRVSPSPASQDIHIVLNDPTNTPGHDKEEPWEKEVDDLVEWTNNLDTNTIDT